MLKRIRKMSKQKANGKEQEELAKSKDKGENKSSSKEQEELAKSKDKGENKSSSKEHEELAKDEACNMKEEADLTALQSERDSLLEEVKKLKGQLETENARYAELKSLKTQQVCALTFKLAKAIRDKERAVEEIQSLKHELKDLRSTREQHEEEKLDVRPDRATLEVVEAREEPVLYKKEDDSDKMTCFVVTGEPMRKAQEDLVEKTVGSGEPREAAEDALNGDDLSDCSSDTLSLSQSSFKSDDQSAKKKVIIEFRRIQKELRDVKKNMSMVQALNERLSRDLQSLVDKKNSHPLVRSQSLRMHRNGSSEFPNDAAVDGKREDVFVSHEPTTKKKEQEKTMQDVSTETEGCDVDQNDASDKKRELQNEQIECSNQESLENTPNGLPVQSESTAHAQVSNQVGDQKERQAKVMEVRKQLEKAMKELEELREDNREMKEKINKIASSTDHDDFLRRTTRFTGAILKEMRQREQRVERKMSKTLPKVYQPPWNVLGTRLNEITKTVDDMTKSEPIPPPLGSTCVTSSVDPPLMSALNPRPQSAGLPTTHTFARQAKPHTEQKKRRFTTGKLGEPSLAHRHVVRLTKEGGLKRSVESLAKEWRSAESLSPRSGFSGSLGYRDYIQRHIVMSSNAIAKIRDLTPEELNGHVIY